MSGHTAFDKLVRPAAVCRGEEAEISQIEEIQETELNGVEEGGGMEGEGEMAPPAWRVRAGSRNKPTQKEREDHEATHVPFRDWCTHSMMGRGGTHHHVIKQKSEDQSTKPTIAMVNGQTRHQNIMSSVALDKGFEEPWRTERVAKFLVLLGYHEITLKNNTEPVIIAFRDRVPEMCSVEAIEWARREHRGC